MFDDDVTDVPYHEETRALHDLQSEAEQVRHLVAESRRLVFAPASLGEALGDDAVTPVAHHGGVHPASSQRSTPRMLPVASAMEVSAAP